MLFVALFLLFGPPIFLAVLLIHGAWRWFRMSDDERSLYRNLPASAGATSTEWGDILTHGYSPIPWR